METVLFRTLRTIFSIQLLPLFLLFGCLASEAALDESDAIAGEEVASETYAVMVDVDPESLEPTITLPDGSVTHSFDAYADVVAQIYETTPAAEFIIGFGPVLDAQIAADLDETGERWQTTVGSYFIADFHLLGTSMKRSIKHRRRLPLQADMETRLGHLKPGNTITVNGQPFIVTGLHHSPEHAEEKELQILLDRDNLLICVRPGCASLIRSVGEPPNCAWLPQPLSSIEV